MAGFTVHRVVPYEPGAVFDLVADVERYPEFLPAWQDARVLRRDGDALVVEQQIGLRRLHWRFRTRARLERPRRIHIEGHDGPFEHLRQDWRFDTVPGGRTLITFKVDYELVRTPLRAMVARLIDDGFQRTLRAFERRARQLYG